LGLGKQPFAEAGNDPLAWGEPCSFSNLGGGLVGG